MNGWMMANMVLESTFLELCILRDNGKVPVSFCILIGKAHGVQDHLWNLSA